MRPCVRESTLLSGTFHTENESSHLAKQPSRRLDGDEPWGGAGPASCWLAFLRPERDGQEVHSPRIGGGYSTGGPDSETAQLPNLAILLGRRRGEIEYEIT